MKKSARRGLPAGHHANFQKALEGKGGDGMATMTQPSSRSRAACRGADTAPGGPSGRDDTRFS